MRGSTLRTIRNRVDRLAAECLVDREPILVHWMDGYERCPSCGYDLNAHSSTAALAEVQERNGPAAAAPIFIWFSTAGLDACPACGGALPQI